MSKAVVLLSGGLASTTTLAIAKSEKFDYYACVLRQNGFTQAGVVDPTKYQLNI